MKGGKTCDHEPLCEQCARVRAVKEDVFYPLAKPSTCNRCGVDLDPVEEPRELLRYL